MLCLEITDEDTACLQIIICKAEYLGDPCLVRNIIDTVADAYYGIHCSEELKFLHILQKVQYAVISVKLLLFICHLKHIL